MAAASGTGKARGKEFQINKRNTDPSRSKPRKAKVKQTRLTYTHTGEPPRNPNLPAPGVSTPRNPIK